MKINGIPWAEGSGCEYVSSVAGDKGFGHVICFYRVQMDLMYPYPKILKLVHVLPCENIGVQHGAQNVYINRPLTPVVIDLKSLTHLIVIGKHRYNPNLRSADRAGSTVP